VPFREGSHYYERQLQRPDQQTSKGAFGRAVRTISDAEYEAILRAGFARELGSGEPYGAGPSAAAPLSGLADEALAFERPVVERVLSRPVRDEAFRQAVQDAYGQTCAMTGLRLINGGGRAEVQAAHIRPVNDRGPDSVRNGVALSATVHWMFDRGLVSIGPPPDYRILVANRGLPDNVTRLFNPDGRLRLPGSPLLRPAPAFLDYHRRVVFGG
jgi:putative restriction endonuclease